MRAFIICYIIVAFSCALPDDTTPVVINVTISSNESAYKVTYNTNGATKGDVPLDKNEYKQGDIVRIMDGSNILKGDNPSTCWNSTPDGTGIQYNFSQYVIIGSGDIELFSQF